MSENAEQRQELWECGGIGIFVVTRTRILRKAINDPGQHGGGGFVSCQEKGFDLVAEFEDGFLGGENKRVKRKTGSRGIIKFH